LLEKPNISLQIDKNRDVFAMKLEQRQSNRYNEVLRMEVWVLKQIQLLDKGVLPRFFCAVVDQGETDKCT
jgi:hypothetical protein